MRLHRNATAIIRHRKIAILTKFHLDEGGMACHSLIHGVVDHLGEKMVQRLFIRAANIHARASANRLQPLQHLDRGGCVAGFGRRRISLSGGQGGVWQGGVGGGQGGWR